jgi:hypothetical protein
MADNSGLRSKTGCVSAIVPDVAGDLVGDAAIGER